MTHALALGALLAVLAGCAPQPDDDGRVLSVVPEQTNTIQVGDLERSYIVRAPEQQDAPMPLLIVLHGAGRDAAAAEQATGFSDAAMANDFVVAYPNGTPANLVEGELAWNAGACCGAAARGAVDDEAFVLAMIAELQASYAIDPSRIYLSGYSNGGMMSYRLACEHGELFAGIAVISGALNFSPCTPTVPLSVLIVHGTADLTVPYNGGETNDRTAARFGQWLNTSVEYATNFWVEHDDCDTDAVVTELEPTTTDTYSGCTDGAEIEVVTIAEGTHTWPRLATLGVDGSELVLTFFALNK